MVVLNKIGKLNFLICLKGGMEKYICQQFQVDHLYQINPWEKHGIPIWEAARQTTFIVDFKDCVAGNLVVPFGGGNYQPKNLFKNLPVNLNDVSVKSMCIKYIKNKDPQKHYYIRRMYDPIFDAEQAKDRREIANNFGYDVGSIDNVLEVPPGCDKIITEHVYPENPNALYLNDACIKTFMLMDREILMRGIRRVPREIEETHFILIPFRHVLAWALNYKEYFREERGLFAREIIAVPPEQEKNPYILFYAVTQETFDKLFKECCEEFLGKIDRRPLGQVGVSLYDTTPNQPLSVKPCVSYSVTYIGYPTMLNPPPYFLPVLHPDFPGYLIKLQNEDYFKKFVQDEEDKKIKLKPKSEERGFGF